MTWLEVERAARNGAVVLWGLGVIEEHGRHLPLGTDVYLPYATLKLARRRLTDRGVEALIAPPFYWGINNVTGSFPGSFTVRPDTMRALMLDVFSSLRKDGFEAIFCISGRATRCTTRPWRRPSAGAGPRSACGRTSWSAARGPNGWASRGRTRSS